MIEGYPLQWPLGYTRHTPDERTRGPFRTTFGKARDAILAELSASGYDRSAVVISCNIATRKSDGHPYATAQSPSDPGVAVYWQDENGSWLVLPCDLCIDVSSNMQAVAVSIRDLRRIGKRGVSNFFQRAVGGFKALPGVGETSGMAWWNVLGIDRAAEEHEINQGFRRQARILHPDKGGSAEKWHELQEAYAQALAIHRALQ